jgi:hypothetical protein
MCWNYKCPHLTGLTFSFLDGRNDYISLRNDAVARKGLIRIGIIEL